MILRIEDLKDVCSKILMAVDSTNNVTVADSLELTVKDKILYLAVTNKEYYVTVKLPLEETCDFHATVGANLFLNLIAQTTSDTVELSTSDTALIVKSNGNYKLPLICDAANNSSVTLPKITINNVTAEFDIDTDILTSILMYNSKELSKGMFQQAVQTMYYIDNKGAITFTTGACVNAFTLPSPIKILLNQRTVKLFKLFNTPTTRFMLGHDLINDTISTTKVCLKNDVVELSVILIADDTLINSVPASVIRNVANSTYPYTIVLKKDELLQTINRLSLFSSVKATSRPYGVFKVTDTCVVISDINKTNTEILYLYNTLEDEINYSFILDLSDLRVTIDRIPLEYITLSFGNNQAVIISKDTIINVIPEVVANECI